MRKAAPKQSAFGMGRQFVKHVVPAVLKPARTLWNEVIAFLFISLAVIFIPSGVRTVRNFDGSVGAVLSIAMYAFFIALMVGFGVSSYLRARRISRS